VSWIADPEAWTAVATLTALELVLGIDNIVLLSVVTGKLEASQRATARRVGLMLAMLFRILLLLGLSWVLGLTKPLFSLLGHELSGRDLIMLGGGLFLIAKGVHEIHEKVEGHEGGPAPSGRATMLSVLVQVILLDMVFSLDSVITAIGMAEHVGVMVVAVILSVALMLVIAGPIGAFVEKHPTVKMLALSFLLLIGVVLVADGLGNHIPRGYIYFALVFSVLVEALNLRTGGRRTRA
jgi:predicted tellurium resistance membrane protein TerC